MSKYKSLNSDHLPGRGDVELLDEVVDDEDGHDDDEEVGVDKADDEDRADDGEDLQEQRPKDLRDRHVDDVDVLGEPDEMLRTKIMFSGLGYGNHESQEMVTGNDFSLAENLFEKEEYSKTSYAISLGASQISLEITNDATY